MSPVMAYPDYSDAARMASRTGSRMWASKGIGSIVDGASIFHHLRLDHVRAPVLQVFGHGEGKPVQPVAVAAVAQIRPQLAGRVPADEPVIDVEVDVKRLVRHGVLPHVTGDGGAIECLGNLLMPRRKMRRKAPRENQEAESNGVKGKDDVDDAHRRAVGPEFALLIPAGERVVRAKQGRMICSI